MVGNLIELSTKTLLGKFGAGSHKPGSGSAAAFEGMLSAQLILTVIDLTSDEKRRKDYQSALPTLSTFSSEIKTRIYPKLEKLFQRDSEQFDAAIRLRVARDKQTSIKQSRELEQQAIDAIKAATEIPIEVATLCIELAEFALFMFNNGFRSARGDSGVALNSAAAAIGGCLSIINLNLLSINDREWLNNMKRTVKQLKFDYETVLLSINNCLGILEQEVEIHESLQVQIDELKARKPYKENLTNKEIEEVAREVQNILWSHRSIIWKRNNPENHRSILKPNVAIEKLLGYKVIKRESLGTYNIQGEICEVAGIIDNERKVVGISTNFSDSTQNFTLAHELGHALLHKQAILHRDRAVDGYSGNLRNPIELQADKFATYFLMPRKQIKEFFVETFLME